MTTAFVVCDVISLFSGNGRYLRCVRSTLAVLLVSVFNARTSVIIQFQNARFNIHKPEKSKKLAFTDFVVFIFNELDSIQSGGRHGIESTS